MLPDIDFKVNEPLTLVLFRETPQAIPAWFLKPWKRGLDVLSNDAVRPGETVSIEGRGKTLAGQVRATAQLGRCCHILIEIYAFS